MELVVATLDEAQHYFEVLKHEVHTIFCLVSDFEAIFPPDVEDQQPSPLLSWQDHPPRRQLIERVALRFFGDLNSMMQEQYVLKLARLGDPAAMPNGRRKNLTIKGMQAMLGDAGRTTDEVDELAQALTDFINKAAKPARDRVIAHSDCETHTSGLTLGGASDEETETFHSQLQTYCDAVARQLELDPAQLVGSQAGDAHDLMRALEWAYKVRVTCTDYACPFQKYDIRPVRALV
jgi:hypothetical protein